MKTYNDEIGQEQKIAYLVAIDIADIEANFQDEKCSFLSSVLEGNGWVPYGQLTPEQLDLEYYNRLSDTGYEFENHPCTERVLFWHSCLLGKGK